MTGRKTRTVVCPDFHCFKVDAETLEPLSCTFYEPAILVDPFPDSPNMSYSAWLREHMPMMEERYCPRKDTRRQ